MRIEAGWNFGMMRVMPTCSNLTRLAKKRGRWLFSVACFWMMSLSLGAAEWTWTWHATGEEAPKAEICPLQYGKLWAYAVEIDDGPKWIRTFAAPFLAQYHFSDAPPGVSGGKPCPFVGSAAVIVGSVGAYDGILRWEDVNKLVESGWGVMNHSFDHRANHWGGPSKLLTSREAREDAFWSQSVLAAHLAGGRAPTGAVYANGYVGYNQDGALEAAGIAMATRVNASSPRDVYSPDVRWMDFPRSYLDENVWSNAWNKGLTLADFPLSTNGSPSTNSLVIDFTHEISSVAGSPNQERWCARLQTIASRWGLEGSDTLWCAPTAEVADYVRAAAIAKVRISPGRLTVSLPDEMPGSALTLRLTGMGAGNPPPAPEGASVYRRGNELFVTTPRIGARGAVPPQPNVKCIYDGPAVSITLPKATPIAGVILRLSGNPPASVPCELAIQTDKGARVFARLEIPAGWVVGSQLCPIAPSEPPIVGTGIVVHASDPVKTMSVWAVEETPPQ